MGIKYFVCHQLAPPDYHKVVTYTRRMIRFHVPAGTEIIEISAIKSLEQFASLDRHVIKVLLSFLTLFDLSFLSSDSYSFDAGVHGTYVVPVDCPSPGEPWFY